MGCYNMALSYEKWGNNDFHDPELCKGCEYGSCQVCSNGPRLAEYRRAQAESQLKDAEYETSQWSGIDDC